MTTYATRAVVALALNSNVFFFYFCLIEIDVSAVSGKEKKCLRLNKY